MNENRIQQILASEKKAMDIYEAAVKEAGQMPQAAEQEAQAMLARAQQEAEEEARALLAHSRPDAECAQILDQLSEKLSHTEKLAKMNADRASDYALACVIGLEKP